MKRWRFRTGFGGKLVLQIGYFIGSVTGESWRDADTTDLAQYYADLHSLLRQQP